ncbi:MAG: hypothetical protein KF823_08765 [Xanthomonadales bacterium]|nr:hypothetical protein [Xanthomonadales bacterium]
MNIPHRPRARLALFVSSLALAAGQAMAQGPVAIPNADFSDPGNAGSVGGLLGADIVNQPIGAGPWLGSSFGVAGLLARPVLTVDPAQQNASISGLLGINIAGILNNRGWFSQTLGESWQFGRFYILSADITTGSPLNLGLLSGSNTGIALTAAGTPIASSTTAPPQLAELTLLGANEYRLRFGYLADIAASGFIGVRLFSEPQGVLGANLIPSISFTGAVELEGRDIGPPAEIVIDTFSGDLQAQVGQPIGNPIIAIVRDGDGDGVPGLMVRISAPLTGASADLTAPSSSDPPGRVITARSDLDGLVVFFATANDIAGCYRITVEPVDASLGLTPAVFHMRNWSTDPAQDSIYCNGYQ